MACLMTSCLMTPSYSLIAWLMGLTLGPSGSTAPRWAPYWPHELCYLGLAEAILTSPNNNSVTVRKQSYSSFLSHTHYLAHISPGQWIKTLSPRLNRRHFGDDIFKCIFVNKIFKGFRPCLIRPKPNLFFYFQNPLCLFRLDFWNRIWICESAKPAPETFIGFKMADGE